MLQIRYMLDTDADTVLGIEQQTLSPWSQSALFSELEYDRGICLVAERKGVHKIDSQVVGWCCCRYLPPEAELLKIAVHKESRNLGIASSLLADLEQLLKAENIEKLFLEVRSQNHSAVGFYHKCGFYQVGVRLDYYSAPNDNALLYQKTLQYGGDL